MAPLYGNKGSFVAFFKGHCLRSFIIMFEFLFFFCHQSRVIPVCSSNNLNYYSKVVD